MNLIIETSNKYEIQPIAPPKKIRPNLTHLTPQNQLGASQNPMQNQRLFDQNQINSNFNEFKARFHHFQNTMINPGSSNLGLNNTSSTSESSEQSPKPSNLNPNAPDFTSQGNSGHSSPQCFAPNYPSNFMRYPHQYVHAPFQDWDEKYFAEVLDQTTQTASPSFSVKIKPDLRKSQLAPMNPTVFSNNKRKFRITNKRDIYHRSSKIFCIE